MASSWPLLGCERHVEKAKEQVPIVTVGRRIDLTGVDSVFVDNEKVGYLAGAFDRTRSSFLCSRLRGT